MDKNYVTYAVVLMFFLLPVSIAYGQLPADLSVPAPIDDSSARAMSPDLSGGDSAGYLEAAGSRSRARAVVGVPSFPGQGNASGLGSHSPVVTRHAAALPSPSLFHGQRKVLQESWLTPVRPRAKAVSRRVGSTSLDISRVGSSVPSSSTTATMLLPPSFSRRSSVSKEPLYSLIVGHDKGGERFVSRRQGSSLRSAKQSRSGVLQSLIGAEGLSSSRR